MNKAFIHKHIVCFEETNVVGNVYFARHVAWQGACREMFLRAHAPGILDEIEHDLRLVTISVSCEYFQELRAFDEIELLMSLKNCHGNRISLNFDYRVLREGGAQNCALGEQTIGCMKVTGKEMMATPPPQELLQALQPFMAQS